MSGPEPTLICVVTRYQVSQWGLTAITTAEPTSYWVERGYLHLGNSAASGPVERLLERAREGGDWLAQFGTPPVFLDGCWGGRNYPEVRVAAAELVRVLTGVEATT